MAKKEKKESFHWADGIAEQLARQGSRKKQFTCEAGIAPSGTVHIGHFREIMTVELVARALRDKGKKARFIYSWDDFDRFRKVPANMPKQNLLKDYLSMPLSSAPDPFDCHKNYAEHFEKEFEAEMPKLGINPEFLHQAKKYQACEYSDEIKFALQNREKFKRILDRFRKEPLPENWWPVQIYCEACGKDTARVLSWDSNFNLEYECSCGKRNKVDFSRKGIVKLPWRIDWPMRWHYEQVDFEPGGKEHSTPGGSRDTAKEMAEQVYKEKAPLYLMYDYIIIKGIGGKMSSSLGNVITPKECLKIYEPEILRYLFASTRPNTEFSISFDSDVLKIYSEYDKIEEGYFSRSRKSSLDKKQKRIYELSQVKQEKPKKIFAPGFRQLVELVQLKSENEILQVFKKDIKTAADRERTVGRTRLARNWLAYAPENIKFRIQEKVIPEAKSRLAKEQIAALNEFSKSKISELCSEEKIMKRITGICQQKSIKPKEFFQAAYIAILGKENGPRLSSLIMLEKEKIIKLLKSV